MNTLPTYVCALAVINDDVITTDDVEIAKASIQWKNKSTDMDLLQKDFTVFVQEHLIMIDPEHIEILWEQPKAAQHRFMDVFGGDTIKFMFQGDNGRMYIILMVEEQEESGVY